MSARLKLLFKLKFKKIFLFIESTKRQIIYIRKKCLANRSLKDKYAERNHVTKISLLIYLKKIL